MFRFDLGDKVFLVAETCVNFYTPKPLLNIIYPHFMTNFQRNVKLCSHFNPSNITIATIHVMKNRIMIKMHHVYVRPHFGTVPVLALVVQFLNWNTHLPKLALAFFLCWCPFGDHTDSKYGNRCSIFLNLYSEVGY